MSGRVLVTTQDLAVVDVVPASQKRVVKVEAGFTEQESLEVGSRCSIVHFLHVLGPFCTYAQSLNIAISLNITIGLLLTDIIAILRQDFSPGSVASTSPSFLLFLLPSYRWKLEPMGRGGKGIMCALAWHD